MNFFDKMYVGFQRERYNQDDTARILGFAVPYEQTKASEKRRATVDGWRQKDIEPRILDNTPQRGFKLMQVVSRYSTSNKLFRVLDPRGFELEISADNLLDIATVSTIVKGEIIEECVWATSNGNYLEPVSSERYKLYKSQKKDGPVKISPGSYYVPVGNMVSVFRYEGTWQHTYLEYTHVATKGASEVVPTARYSYSHRDYNVTVAEYDTNVKIQMNSGGKPVNVYTEFTLDDEGNITKKAVHIRKSHFKNMLAFEGDTTEMEKYIPDMTQWVNRDGYYYDPSEKADTIITNSSTVYSAYFKTKEEARAFDYSKIISNLKPNMNRYSSSINVDRLTYTNDYRPSYYYRNNNVSMLNAVQTFKVEDLR